MTSNSPASKNGNRSSGLASVRKKLCLIAAFAALAVAAACSVTARTADHSRAATFERPVTQAQVDDKLRTCSECHSAAGRFTILTFPILAGQRKGYLVAQLKAFRDKTRTDPAGATLLMAPMAAGLDNPMIERLAAHYSAQNPLPGSAQNQAYVAAGRHVYQHGVADRVLPCMACHGSRAAGAGVTPRLAGQTRLYLVHQIADFAANTRPGASMHQEAMNLTGPQRRDVVDYVAAETTGKRVSPTRGDVVTQRQFARTVKVCSACHEFGGRGISISPAFVFPRLAGQHKAYLVAQLKAFRDKTRADPRARAYMWNQAAGLDDAMIERLASYYSAKNPVPGFPQTPTGVAAGKIIYQQGVADKVLSCMACHGARAEGLGAIPRLAGQRRLSLVRQLTYFATKSRPNVLMQNEAANLTGPQRGDVADYLAAQTEGKPVTATQTGAGSQQRFARTVKVCSACHEFGGRNVSISRAFTFPRLAGQQKAYLVAQLKAFRDKTRADPRARAYMWNQAAGLDNAMIERLASYYAAQNPVPGSAQTSTGVAAGKIIYQQGVADKVLSCMACHGARAKGFGRIPRLAGQRRLSLERQLDYFAANTRADGLMHREATNLTGQQRRAVAEYLAGLSEGKPNRATRTGAVTPGQFAGMVKVCSTCHEFGGGGSISSAFTFPRLAGQQKDYLIAQLKAFRDRTRDDPRARTYMWNEAAGLNDAVIGRLAGYYSAQKPRSGSPQNPAAIAAGRTIYQQGIPDKIPPCMACHLPEAQGSGTTPRLAGQHRLILERRLEYFAANEPRDGLMMHQEADHLTVRQITDISTYLASLHFSDQ